MQIYDMKVNHLTQPLGYRMERTVFGWKVKGAKGKYQNAARIQVATDETMKNLLKDTGFDVSADSLGTKVEIPLSPRTRYYWKVTVQTDAGEEQESAIQWFETGKREEGWQAEWITCDAKEDRHPFFEKEIYPQQKVAAARLYICGLGLYEAFFNGKRIGEEYLTPYCNDYHEWVQYQTYDITELLQESGVLSVLLGNGWYKGRFGLDPNRRTGYYGNEWKLLAELRIRYEDGTEAVIGTDENWNVRRSTIQFSNLYDGEHRDDTLKELPMEPAQKCEAPRGALTERMSVPVTVHERLQPKELLHTPAGEMVLDLGQEIAGIFTLCVNVPAGTEIRIQTGEILQNGNFYNENLRSAKSEYRYISDGTEQMLTPHFTYYGYRYVKIEGVSALKKEDFTGLALYSDLQETGQIETGHELVNQLISNVRWSLKDNFIDVPTDCPQRDERMGWTGDAQVFSRTATYLMDTYCFYAKYLYDMAKEQAVRGGKVPDVIPNFGMESTASVWGDACCIIPWNLYLFYGDKSILEEQYESMKSWVDYIGSVDGNHHGWRKVFHYGDWLALDHPNRKPDQMLGGTEEGFIANIYYAASAQLVAKAAKVLGKTEEEQKYARLSEKQFEEVKLEYYSPNGRCCIHTQTAYLLTLKYGLSERVKWTAGKLRELFMYNGDKLQTGFVGTPILGNVLSENGLSELAYLLLLNEEEPGWLYEVKLGATTVWERWNSVQADGSISGTGMNSLNHYSYGSIVEWMFRHMAGIRFDEKVPGCRKAVVEPLLNRKLKEVHAKYDSPAGTYQVAWKVTDAKHVELEVSVPFGCEAWLKLPNADPKAIEEQETPMLAEYQDGVCRLLPGTYRITYEMAEPLKGLYHSGVPMQELMGNPAVKSVLMQLFPATDQLPQQFTQYTIREINAMLNLPTDEKVLEQLDKMLEAF